MRPRGAHEFPENIRGQFFRAAGVVDDSGDDPGNASIVEMKQLARIGASCWSDNFRKRMAFGVHTNKTLGLWKM